MARPRPLTPRFTIPTLAIVSDRRAAICGVESVEPFSAIRMRHSYDAKPSLRNACSLRVLASRLFSSLSTGRTTSIEVATGTDADSVEEVPGSGEDHGHPQSVGRLDHLVVAERAARLDDGRYAALGRHLDVVCERHEGV